MPMGTRSSEPRTTGTAVRKRVEVLERPSVSWNFFASGAINAQTEKQAMNARVASARFQYGEWVSERLGFMRSTVEPGPPRGHDQDCSIAGAPRREASRDVPDEGGPSMSAVAAVSP